MGECVVTWSGGSASAPSSSSTSYNSVPFSRPFPPGFLWEPDEEIPPNRRNILPFVLLAIRQSNRFVSITESNLRIPCPGKESKLILTVISPARIWSRLVIPARIISPALLRSRFHRYLCTRESSSFSHRADFSCSSCACYSFVDRRSSSARNIAVRSEDYGNDRRTDPVLRARI